MSERPVSVEITQADIDATILACRWTGWMGVASRLGRGWRPEPGTSEANLIELFARHRIAAVADDTWKAIR